MLNRELNVILTNISAWNSPNTNGFAGLGGAQMSEILHHVQVAKVKAEKFYGRHHLIQEVLDTLTLSAAASGMVAGGVGTGDSLRCISLAIIGRTGSGKTALMSKVSETLAAAGGPYADLPVIVRFCGTSAGTVDGHELIKSICWQIMYWYYLPINEATDAKLLKFDDSVMFFHELMKTYPVVLLVDSLDQLANTYEVRSRLTIFLDMKPHPRRLVH